MVAMSEARRSVTIQAAIPKSSPMKAARASKILNLKKRLNEIYVKHTKQPLKRIEDALERDTFLTAEGAKDFGIIDKVIEKRPEELSPSPPKS